MRRWAGPAGGLVTGAGLALTPVAALMFRFDNPDALLVFLLAAPIGLGRRILKLLGALVASVISGGWYVALVSLWPAGPRAPDASERA